MVLNAKLVFLKNALVFPFPMFRQVRKEGKNEQGKSQGAQSIWDNPFFAQLLEDLKKHGLVHGLTPIEDMQELLIVVPISDDVRAYEHEGFTVFDKKHGIAIEYSPATNSVAISFDDKIYYHMEDIHDIRMSVIGKEIHVQIMISPRTKIIKHDYTRPAVIY